ncbi:MAG: UDP-glucose 4-epimerase [Patescibacteria group bacterium]|nr:MAG: UDP-glucose 4-epimerase [Patescibacteria group bacterium]
MKVLITGSSGFIGKHLVKFLKSKKIAVVPFDLVTGQDLFDKKTLDELIREVDYIIHLAAIGDVYQAEKNPQNALKTAILGTQNLIEVANKYTIKKIIYASTWEVYGKPIYQPLDENHPCNPIHPYSIAKLGGELVIRSVFNKIPWIILRLGTVYGPNMRSHAVIPLFINNARKKKPIIIHGSGNQLRQFTYIDDINQAFLLAIKTKIINKTFNIVSPECVSIKEIANLIANKFPVTIKTTATRVGDPPSAVVSSDKARKILGWNSKINIKQGINMLINFFTGY